MSVIVSMCMLMAQRHVLVHVLMALPKEQIQGSYKEQNREYVTNRKRLVKKHQRKNETEIWCAGKHKLRPACPHGARSADVKRTAYPVAQGTDQDCKTEGTPV